MDRDDKWDKIQSSLARQMTKATHDSLFSGTKLLAANGTWVIGCHQHQREWLSNRFTKIIQQTIKSRLGREAQVKIQPFEEIDMTYQDEVLGQLKAQTALLSTISKQLSALASAQQGNSAYQWTPEGRPICPRHQEVMPKREKQGDTWYSHSILDGQGNKHYCRGYASRNSPGWDIEPDDTTPPPPPPPPPAKPAPAKLPKQDIDEMDYHEHEPPPAQPEPTTPQPAPQVKAAFAQPEPSPAPVPQPNNPATNYRQTFYKIVSKAMHEGRITFDKVNDLVSLANVDDWSAALAGLKLTLEGGSV